MFGDNAYSPLTFVDLIPKLGAFDFGTNYRALFIGQHLEAKRRGFMRMRFVHDQTIIQDTDDCLGFSKLITTMQESFENISCPFVFGVIGDWGSGKTSIMRMLCDRLEISPQQGEQKDWAPRRLLWPSVWGWA